MSWKGARDHGATQLTFTGRIFYVSDSHAPQLITGSLQSALMSELSFCLPLDVLSAVQQILGVLKTGRCGIETKEQIICLFL